MNTMQKSSSMKVNDRSVKASVGVWVDHREAVMVFISPQGEVIKKIKSDAEKHAGRIDGVRSTAPHESQQVQADDSRQRSFTERLNHYYDAIIAYLHEVESILIVGPGEAKKELKRRIDLQKSPHDIAAVETTDRMTERQIAAKVRAYFSKIKMMA